MCIAVAVVGLASVGCSPGSGDSSTTSSTAAVFSSTSSASAPSSTAVIGDPAAAVSETFEMLSKSPRDAVVPGLADVVDVEMALPPGAVVVPVLETLRVDGELAEVVAEVELPDGSTDRFGVVLVADGDRWLIAYTVRAP